MISAEGVDEIPEDMAPVDDYIQDAMPDDLPPDGFGY